MCKYPGCQSKPERENACPRHWNLLPRYVQVLLTWKYDPKHDLFIDSLEARNVGFSRMIDIFNRHYINNQVETAVDVVKKKLVEIKTNKYGLLK